jgi:hypothetical protein
MSTKMSWLSLAVALTLPASALAQSCTGGTDFSGHYMFVAARQLFSTPQPPPERITNVPPQYSATAIGTLLRGALGITPFAVAGRLVADAQGGLYAGPADAVYITTRVGSYSVSAECSLTLTITDGFLFIDLIAPPTPATVRFTGVLQSRGGESNLIQSSGGDGVSLMLSRAHQANSCSNATFTGPYGLSASGVQWAAEPAELKLESLSLFNMVGRIVSDGAGNLFSQDGTQGLPLQLTGTYTLLADCTGTARLTDGRIRRNISFVLTQANAAQNFTASGVNFSRPVMRFVIADPKVAATGIGREATGRL